MVYTDPIMQVVLGLPFAIRISRVWSSTTCEPSRIFHREHHRRRRHRRRQMATVAMDHGGHPDKDYGGSPIFQGFPCYRAIMDDELPGGARSLGGGGHGGHSVAVGRCAPASRDVGSSAGKAKRWPCWSFKKKDGCAAAVRSND